MENNYLNTNQRKDIDLSNVLDSEVEQRQQMMYQNSLMNQSKFQNKKKMYLFIIIISWIAIFGIIFTTLAKNVKMKKQVEKNRQEMQLKIKKNNIIQNENK
ncbi:MAG: hypothetical protein PHH83_04845 [Patescibacteria group bacterium]|nr:hypothetical protein [Patescibacteria group bacterium]